MKPSKLLWLALVLLVPVAPVMMVYTARRSATPAPPANSVHLDAPFDPAASAGLFIGVQKYPDRAFTRVQFAVDDAVDLAYTFVLQCGTIPAKRAALALSGTPQKPQSKVRLQQLRNAGVTVMSATRTEILRHLQRSEPVRGLFVVSFAGHGFSRSGTPYLATSNSQLEHPATWLSSMTVVDLVAQRAGRSLVLIDACRERVAEGTRSVIPAPAAALIPKMAKTHGQVVLYAAPAGGWAYDDIKRKNGVFTAAVIEGLQCGTKPTTITVDKLATFVAKDVGDWVRTHKQPGPKSVIQISMGDRAKKMPLVACGVRPPVVPNPFAVAIEGTSLLFLNKAREQLRRVHVGTRITHAEVADLDADLTNEVIAATGSRIIIFEANGTQRRVTDLNAESLHPRGTSMRILSFRIEKLFFGEATRQIVAAAVDATGSRIAIINRDGTFRGTHWYPGKVRNFLLSEEKPKAFLQKIIFWASNRIGMLDPKDLSKPKWHVELPNAGGIADIAVGDHDQDESYDLEIRTLNGKTDYLDFHGRRISRY